jgi:hypothetical protein
MSGRLVVHLMIRAFGRAEALREFSKPLNPLMQCTSVFQFAPSLPLALCMQYGVPETHGGVAGVWGGGGEGS